MTRAAKPAVEIRPDDKGEIDEIVAKGCFVFVERMGKKSFYLGIDGHDGSHWQFWIGGKGKIKFTHHEMTPATKGRKP